MTCGQCGKTDGMVYTSYPSQVKCSVTNQFHKEGDECNVDTTGTVSSSYSYQQYCGFRLPCGICTRTNSVCPINGYTVTPTWGSPTITCSASTGNPISVEALKFDSTTAYINKEEDV